MQAAILRARLPWLRRLDGAAARPRGALPDAGWSARPSTCRLEFDPGHVYHLFPVRSAARESLRAHLAAAGIETLIHYPVPIPRQPALAGADPAACPIAARVCDEILSLPLHPGLSDDEVDAVASEGGRVRRPRSGPGP